MNDFTKKELIALEDAIQQMLIIHQPQSGESPLLKKIQAMIDNYCDPSKIDECFTSIKDYIAWLEQEDYYKLGTLSGFKLCFHQFVDAFKRRGLIK